jgi:hypothetical protein
MARWYTVLLVAVAVTGLALAKGDNMGDKPYVYSPVVQEQGGQPDVVFFSEDFEGGVMPPGWTVIDGNADGFQWQVGVCPHTHNDPPAYGTAFAFYDDDAPGSGSAASLPPEELWSPGVNVAGATALELKYGIGYDDLGNDTAQVYVIFDWGTPILLRTYTADIQVTETIDLTMYLPANNVQVGFVYLDHGSWAWGVGIDNVVLQEPAPPAIYTLIYEWDFNYSEHNFQHLCPANDPDTGPNCYTSDWQWGMPAPPGPEPGEFTCDSVPLSYCWGTILAGNYNNYSCSRLVSPIVSLPDTCDTLLLEICHWYDIETNYDGGNVVIFDPPDPYDGAPALDPIGVYAGKGYDGNAYSSPCLVPYEPVFTGHMSPPWYKSFFDLSAFASKDIRFACDFGSDGSVPYPGWYIKWARIWCVQEPVAVDENMTKDVYGYVLRQAVPNPFTGMTDIGFSLPADADVDLSVFDASGRVVRTLANATMPAGSHTVAWDGRDESGVQAPAGIYFYRMQAGQFDAIRKLILVR